MSDSLGAHLSVAGGSHNALQKIVEIGGNCLQIFSSSPRIWIVPDLNDDQILQFQTLKKALQIDPIYFHATYLINLADPGRIGELSKKALIEELRVAEKLGIRGTIVHTGSFKEFSTTSDPALRAKQSEARQSPSRLLRLEYTPSNDSQKTKYQVLIQNIQEVLAATPPTTLFIIENAGNRKIGLKIEEIAYIIQKTNDQRLRVCLDSCHLFAAGYEFSTQEKLKDFLTTFDSLIGLEKLELIHLNDSRDPFASGRDRHENIGEGTLGLDTFQLLLKHPKLANKPFIIETPGFDKKGPDKKNLDIVKSLRFHP